jgi:hypothetical protein
MTIRQLRAELFHEDGQTDMTKLIVAFLNFASALKNVGIIWSKLVTNCGNDRHVRSLIVKTFVLRTCFSFSNLTVL